MNGGKQQNRLPQRTIESAGLREKKSRRPALSE